MTATHLIILTNLFTIIGVFFLGWNVSSIVFVYWFESLVIGFYNILKMKKAERPIIRGVTININGQAKLDKSKSALIKLFVLHYGAFMLAFGLAFLAILRSNIDIQLSVIFGMIVLLISHGYSYARDYLAREQYKNVNPEDLMGAPYQRVVVMLVILMLGSFISININGVQVGLLLVFVGVKTVIDILAHKYSQEKEIAVAQGRKNPVIHFNPPGIRFLTPFVEKIVGTAYRKSVESGEWEKTKASMDPQTIKEVEDYWSSTDKKSG